MHILISKLDYFNAFAWPQLVRIFEVALYSEVKEKVDESSVAMCTLAAINESSPSITKNEAKISIQILPAELHKCRTSYLLKLVLIPALCSKSFGLLSFPNNAQYNLHKPRGIN